MTESPVACHGDECHPYPGDYKGDWKFPLSAETIARVQWPHGTSENQSCGLWHQISSGMVSKILEGPVHARVAARAGGWAFQGDSRGIWIRHRGDGSSERPHPHLSVVSTEVLDRWSSKDPEKYQRPRAVPSIPIDQEKALEGRALGGWIFCADSRG